MANYRKLWVNWTEKRLMRDNFVGATQPLPFFHKYEGVLFEVAFVEPTGVPAAPYAHLDISTITLKIVINDTFDDASPLVETSGGSWAKNEAQNVFTGVLNLNTAAFNTYISTSDVSTAHFEIEAVDGSGLFKYRELINLRQGVAQTTTTAPDPQAEYLTKDQSLGLFRGTRLNPGEQLVIPSADGSYERILGCTNDGIPTDDILPTS